eukprot:1765435-Rhodomonas_salina.5
MKTTPFQYALFQAYGILYLIAAALTARSTPPHLLRLSYYDLSGAGTNCATYSNMHALCQCGVSYCYSACMHATHALCAVRY